jgi:hypothetical protein
MQNGLSSWVPVDVLVAALCVVIGLLYKLVLDRAKKTELAIDAMTKALHELDKRFVSAATLAQLGSMGDRLDGRITNIAQDLAVLKAVQGERK